MDLDNFLHLDTNGDQISADARGDYLAFICWFCDHPVLTCQAAERPGSDEKFPASCKGCGERYFLDVRLRAEKLYIHPMSALLELEGELGPMS